MLRERFAFVSEQLQNGTITVVSRDQNNLVELQVPKSMLMQLTAEDISRGLHGRFISEFDKRVHFEIVSESKWHVNIILQL